MFFLLDGLFWGVIFPLRNHFPFTLFKKKMSMMMMMMMTMIVSDNDDDDDDDVTLFREG